MKRRRFTLSRMLLCYYDAPITSQAWNNVVNYVTLIRGEKEKRKRRAVILEPPDSRFRTFSEEAKRRKHDPRV